jgi:hypothetical protein
MASRHSQLVQAVIRTLTLWGAEAFPVKNMATMRRGAGGRECWSRGLLKPGVSDVIAFLPPDGRGVAVEVKIGKDKLRPEQEKFRMSVERVGAAHIVVRDTVDALLTAKVEGKI